MSDRDTGLTRRTVLGTAGAAAAALAAPSILRGATPTEDPVRIGHIGLGVRGGNLINYTGAAKTAKIVGVCDVYEPHLRKGVERSNNPDVRTHHDYHDLLADDSIEAVIIATPDHWHERMLLDAIAAGKDVYCEKGWTTSIESAKRMRAAVKNTGAIMQLGHQRRQQSAAEAARRLIEAGELGEITLIQAGNYGNGTMERAPWRWYGGYSMWDHPDPDDVIRQLDWERWLGTAPNIDFNERHFWHWRCYWAYGTGLAGDLMSHSMDFVQAVMGHGIPDTAVCAGMNAYYHDDREVPDTWLVTMQWNDRACSAIYEGTQNSRRGQPVEIIGREGRMIFHEVSEGSSRYELFDDVPATQPVGRRVPEPRRRFDPSEVPTQPNHMEDFLESVRTREKTRCNEDEAFVEAATFLMSVEAYRQHRQVRWDRQREMII